MNFSIGLLQMAGRLIEHSAARQSVIAQNIANANTPGYKARDIASFADSYAESGGAARNGPAGATFRSFESAARGAETPDGNTVSLEDQMVRSAEVRMQHDLALGIYGKSLDILRAGMGRIR